jgi:uncharacterized membrane protein YkvI
VKKWTGAFQIAAVYVGTVVGAGFATGKEIVEFFTRFGLVGFAGLLVSGYLFTILGSKLMVKAVEMKAKSFEDFNVHLFGKSFAAVMNILMMFMLIAVTGVMLSGAGAVFQEQLHMNKEMGIGLTISLTLGVMMLGTKGLFAVNTFIVPMMILFNLLLMSRSVTGHNFIHSLLYIPHINNWWKAAAAPFAYVAFNLGLSQAVLVPVAAEMNDREAVKLGGRIGGILLTLILISSHFALVSLPNVTIHEIPMAVIVKNTFSSIYFIYVTVIFGEIFTSIVGDIYGLEKQFKQFLPLKSIWIYLIIILLIYLISKMKYGALLGLIYPLFGYVSIIFIALLWLKPYGKMK